MTPRRYQGRERISPPTFGAELAKTSSRGRQDRKQPRVHVVRGCPAPGCSETTPSQLLISSCCFEARPQNFRELDGCTVNTETDFTINGLQWTYFCIPQQSATARECFLLPVGYLLSYTYIKLWILDLKFLFPPPPPKKATEIELLGCKISNTLYLQFSSKNLPPLFFITTWRTAIQHIPFFTTLSLRKI